MGLTPRGCCTHVKLLQIYFSPHRNTYKGKRTRLNMEKCERCNRNKYNEKKVCETCLDEIHYEAIRNEPYGADDFMNYCMTGDCW